MMVMKTELIDHFRSSKMQRGHKAYSARAIFVFCLASFLAGSFFSGRSFWSIHSDSSSDFRFLNRECDHKRKLVEGSYGEQQSGGHVTKSLDETMPTLETELAAAARRVLIRKNRNKNSTATKAFVVIGINTAFSSEKRREAVRATWMGHSSRREKKRLEEEKGVVMRFVIGRSSGGAAERALEAEEAEHGDFLRLPDHMEGYHRLSSKTRAYFSAAVALWPEARFFVKVDDDVHLNVAALVSALAKHRRRPRVYVGCMKSGPVLYDQGEKYHEPEFLRFGDKGNGYFRHATGQIYAISNDLASYIAANGPILHTYANEDVSLGSWLVGLEVEHVDDRSMCCGTPPDCEWKAQEGNVCVASFDWHCSGICKSEERMKDVHVSCGEGAGALSSLDRLPYS